MRNGENNAYKESIEQRNILLSQVQADIKDIVFDYFNIISKEYEMGYEKFKYEETYKNAVNDIKKQVDE